MARLWILLEFGRKAVYTFYTLLQHDLNDSVRVAEIEGWLGHALERIVQFYELRNLPEKAEEYRTLLAVNPGG